VHESRAKRRSPAAEQAITAAGVLRQAEFVQMVDLIQPIKRETSSIPVDMIHREREAL
jgi:hypothetical protein